MQNKRYVKYKLTEYQFPCNERSSTNTTSRLTVLTETSHPTRQQKNHPTSFSKPYIIHTYRQTIHG